MDAGGIGMMLKVITLAAVVEKIPDGAVGKPWPPPRRR
jgi:hypothetical protein